MTINAVIFDLDNTLLNRREAFKVYANKFISQFVVTISENHRNEISDYIIKADMGGYRNKKELYQELYTNLEMKETGTTVEDLLEFWFLEFSKCTVPMDGAIDILQYFKSLNIKLGLITNGSIRGQNLKIDYAYIRNFFDSIIISDEVGIKKPDKRIFDLSLETLQISADSTIFVGDQPYNDVKGAEYAGLKAVWLRGFSEWNINEEQPKYSINRLSELKSVFDSISAEPRNF